MLCTQFDMYLFYLFEKCEPKSDYSFYLHKKTNEHTCASIGTISMLGWIVINDATKWVSSVTLAYLSSKAVTGAGGPLCQIVSK